jgi:hypothetical protein
MLNHVKSGSKAHYLKAEIHIHARTYRTLLVTATPAMATTGLAMTAVTLTFSKGKAGGRVPAAGIPALYSRSMRIFSRTLTPILEVQGREGKGSSGGEK